MAFSKKQMAEKRAKAEVVRAEKPHTLYVYKRRRIRKLRLFLAVLILITIFLIAAFPRQSIQYAGMCAEKARSLALGTIETLGLFRTQTMAIVNGEAITKNDFDREIRIMLFLNGIPDSYKESLDKRAVLDQIITRRILLQQAKKSGISVSESEGEQILQSVINQSSLTPELIRSIMDARGIRYSDLTRYYAEEASIVRYINMSVEPKISVDEMDILNFYNETKSRYTAPNGTIRLRVIVLNSEEKAEQIYKMLAVNSSSFPTFAYYESVDQNSARYGGDLGFISNKSLPAPLSQVAFQLKVGELSAPVPYNNSYYIFKREADIIGYEELRDQIEQGLRATIRNSLVLQLIDKLRREANITYAEMEAPTRAQQGELANRT